MTKTSSLINVRTLLLIAMSLSSLAVLRQRVNMQLFVTAVSLLLLLLHPDRKAIFTKLFGRFRHLWLAVLSIFLLQLVFRREGEEVLRFYLLSITGTGVQYGIIVALRLVNLILISGLLFSISSSEYLLAFRAWKIPYEISFLITTVIRFIPDYYRMFAAYRETIYLRNVNVKKLSLKNKGMMLIALLVPVLTSCLAEVKYRVIALELKGFRLYPGRTYLHESKLKAQDYLIQVGVVLLFVVMLILS